MKFYTGAIIIALSGSVAAFSSSSRQSIRSKSFGCVLFVLTTLLVIGSILYFIFPAHSFYLKSHIAFILFVL